jgi:MtaA/CmuA family methyltransferase
MTSKERLHAALAGERVDRAPVTPIFMAWAGNYIGRSYRDYYLDGSVMAASQMAIARDFGVDQVSSISDPWREADAYGMEFDYPPEGVGIPRRHLLEAEEDFDRFKPFDPAKGKRTADRIEAVRILVREMGATHSVLGWVEGILAEYVDLRGLEDACIDLIEEPERFHRIAAVLLPVAIEFASIQIELGADVIGVGDAAASVIGPELYREHVLPYEQKLFGAFHAQGAKGKLHICGNTNAIVADMAQSGADILDLDWMVPIASTRAKVGDSVTLCGNFDPTAVVLRGTPEQNAEAARRCVEEGGRRFILQPGCEVPPGSPRENVAAFCPGPL